MKTRHYITIITIAVIYTILGNSFIYAQTSPDYYPLNIGSTWTEQYTPLRSNTAPSHTLQTLIEDVEDNGLYRIKTWSEETNDSYGWLRKDVNGDVYFCKIGASPDIILAEFDPPWLLIDASELREHGIWQFHDKAQRVANNDSTITVTMTHTMIVDRVNESVTVPAGTFTDCIKVSSSVVSSQGDALSVSTTYYAQDVGRVLKETYFPADQTSRTELLEYEISRANSP